MHLRNSCDRFTSSWAIRNSPGLTDGSGVNDGTCRASAYRRPNSRQTAARRPGLDIDTHTRNAIQRSLRCLGERGFALLAGRWRTLQHITVSPSKIGNIARAAFVLTHFEHGYIT
jgi:hypothetical protein